MALPAEFPGSDQRGGLSIADFPRTDPNESGVLVTFHHAELVNYDEQSSLSTQDVDDVFGIYQHLKLAIDISIASLLFVLALPVFAVLALSVGITSPGGIFFRQTRVGKDLQPFQCLKFRTMVPDAESILERDSDLARIHALNWKLDNDPRVTKIGRFLRKTSLDELPQLINVINGEMSLVGPRPVQKKELEVHYGPLAEKAFCVRPGVTGLWQVSGRSNLSYAERVALDLEYSRQMSFLVDLKVVALTIPAVLLRRGAH